MQRSRTYLDRPGRLARVLGQGASSTAVSTLGLTGVIACVAFAANVATSRVLGPSGRGELALMLQLSYVVGPLALGGADRLIVSGRSESKWPTARYSTVVIGIVALALGLAVYPQDPRPWYLLWVVPVLLTDAYAALTRARSLAEKRPAIYARWVLFQQSGLVIGILLLIALGANSSVVWAVLWGWPASFVLAWLFRNWTSSHIDRSTLVASLSLLPGAMASLVILRAERLILPAFAGTDALGVYVAIATILEFSSLPGTVLADIWSNRDERPNVRAFLQVLVLSALVVSIVAVITYLTIPMLFGVEFVVGRDLILPLSLASFSLVCYRLVVARALASARPTTSTRIEVCGAMIALVIYPLAAALGAGVGVAWGTLVVYLLCSLVGVTMLGRVTRQGVRA